MLMLWRCAFLVATAAALAQAGTPSSYVGVCRRCIFGFESNCATPNSLRGVGIPLHVGSKTPTNPFNNTYGPHESHPAAADYIGLRGEAQASRTTRTFVHHPGTVFQFDTYLEGADAVMYESVTLCAQADVELRVGLVENGCSMPNSRNPYQTHTRPGVYVCRENAPLRPLAYWTKHANTGVAGNFPVYGSINRAPPKYHPCQPTPQKTIPFSYERAGDEGSANWVPPLTVSGKGSSFPYSYPITTVSSATDDAVLWVSSRGVAIGTLSDTNTCYMSQVAPRVKFFIDTYGAGAIFNVLQSSVPTPLPKGMTSGTFTFGKAGEDGARKFVGEDNEQYRVRLHLANYAKVYPSHGHLPHLTQEPSEAVALALRDLCFWDKSEYGKCYSGGLGTVGTQYGTSNIAGVPYPSWKIVGKTDARWMAALMPIGVAGQSLWEYLRTNFYFSIGGAPINYLEPDFPYWYDYDRLNVEAFLESPWAEESGGDSSETDPESINGRYSNYLLWCNVAIQADGATAKNNVNPNWQPTVDYFTIHGEWYGGSVPPLAQMPGCCPNTTDNPLPLHSDAAERSKQYIICGAGRSSGVCACSRGRVGMLCNETIPDEFDPETATDCPDFDICSGRGRCVVKPGGIGVQCKCRPGWWGGGSVDDPLAGLGSGDKPIPKHVMVDLYAYLTVNECAHPGQDTYVISTDAEVQWLLKYPSLHQCMLWDALGIVSKADVRRWTNARYLIYYDDTGEDQPDIGKDTKDSERLAFQLRPMGSPIFPFDCAAYITQGEEFANAAVTTGPVYGGWHCNRCPQCVWDNTARCDDTYPDLAWQTDDRFNENASVRCYCKEGWGGELCDVLDCPRFGDNDTYWIGKNPKTIDTSPCLSDTGRGTCLRTVTPAPKQRWPFSSKNPVQAFAAFNWSYVDTSIVFENPYVTHVLELPHVNGTRLNYSGVCDCSPGYYGPRCELTECQRDKDGNLCGAGGMCLYPGALESNNSVPLFTERWRYPVPDTFARNASKSQSGCEEFYLNHTTTSGSIWNFQNPDFRDYAYVGCMFTTDTGFPCLGKPANISAVYDPLTYYNSTPDPGPDGFCHWIPYFYAYGGLPLGTNTTRTCQCVKRSSVGTFAPSGYIKDDNGLCTLRSCPFNPATGLECNGLKRFDDPTKGVCNRDLDTPVCECWRAMRGPTVHAYDGSLAFFSGDLGACELSYDTVCNNESIVNRTCSGPTVSLGCYIDGCGTSDLTWENCQQGLNRTAAVPRCHCLTEQTGAYGDNCETSLCGGFPSTAPCTENNTGTLRTGKCNPSTRLCDCIPPEGSGNQNGVAHIGPYCNISVRSCQLTAGDHVCSNHGQCVLSGSSYACDCSSDYTGTYCESTVACGGTCNSEGGLCISGTCHCFRNWIGTNCDVNQCNVTGGTPLGPNVCECPAGSTQYPNHLDPSWGPFPANTKDPSPGIMNPSGLDSFRGCRLLCASSEFVEAPTECGGYVVDTSGQNKTRCLQRKAYNKSYPSQNVILPNCTCTGIGYTAVNPNVNQVFEGVQLDVDWVAYGGSYSLGGQTCKPKCAFCFESPSNGACEKDVCTGIHSNITGDNGKPACQYRDTFCSQLSCPASDATHPDHVFDIALGRCVCSPEWQWDNTGNCTLSHNKCVLTGGSPPLGWQHSGHVSEPCVCQFPFKTNYNITQVHSTYRLCVPDCGVAGTASPGDTACTCIPGGVISGIGCNISACEEGLGTPDYATDSTGVPVYCDKCMCKYAQWGGTFCNTSQCHAGTPKSVPAQGCDCYRGWNGTLCDRPIGCDPHGHPSNATSSAECICDPGWNGTRCEHNKCLVSLVASSGLDHTYHQMGVQPDPCSDSATNMQDCLRANLEYNCYCGEQHATFDNVTAMGCTNTSHLDCGSHGVWGVHSHNNTHACICEHYYIGARCERHVCDDIDAGWRSNSLRIAMHHAINSLGVIEYTCGCNVPAYYYDTGSNACVVNCTDENALYPETWLHPIPDPDTGDTCICPHEDYVYDTIPPVWLSEAYNESEGRHCRFACDMRYTLAIGNASCFCRDGFYGRFCTEMYLWEEADAFKDLPLWAAITLPGVVVVSVLGAVLWTGGLMPTSCYSSTNEKTVRYGQLTGSPTTEEDAVNGRVHDARDDL